MEVALGRVETVTDALASIPPIRAGRALLVAGGPAITEPKAAAAFGVAPPRPIRGVARLVLIGAGAIEDSLAAWRWGGPVLSPPQKRTNPIPPQPFAIPYRV